MAPTEQYIINHLNIVRTKLNQLIKKRQEEMKMQKEGQPPKGRESEKKSSNMVWKALKRKMNA